MDEGSSGRLSSSSTGAPTDSTVSSESDPAADDEARSISTRPPKTAKTVDLNAYDLPQFVATREFIKGDGNCQYRALAHLLYGDQSLHEAVRRLIVGEINDNSHRYDESLSESGHTFAARQSANGEWGVEQTLAAAARVFGKKIIVLSLASDRPFFLAYGSRDVDSNAPGLLFENNHYELLYRKAFGTQVTSRGQ
ncbi:hypothetical protein VP01_99g7 [Puccinia sorghi]|uniref:OTU domain-containing protein n=1 Tax=Puccinia sorghi TaxID=27349 RepID=A0A0L6U571_9BASI|nr:hypothetical protein VP01_99g7 [Puccinia sorghi]